MATIFTHEQLAAAWCQWNGQRGTAKQVARIMRYMTPAELLRLLSDRKALPQVAA